MISIDYGALNCADLAIIIIIIIIHFYQLDRYTNLKK